MIIPLTKRLNLLIGHKPKMNKEEKEYYGDKIDTISAYRFEYLSKKNKSGIVINYNVIEDTVLSGNHVVKDPIDYLISCLVHEFVHDAISNVVDIDTSEKYDNLKTLAIGQDDNTFLLNVNFDSLYLDSYSNLCGLGYCFNTNVVG